MSRTPSRGGGASLGQTQESQQSKDGANSNAGFAPSVLHGANAPSRFTTPAGKPAPDRAPSLLARVALPAFNDVLALNIKNKKK